MQRVHTFILNGALIYYLEKKKRSSGDDSAPDKSSKKRPTNTSPVSQNVFNRIF